MDLKKVYQEIYADGFAWNQLFFKYPVLKKYFSLIEHEKKEMVKTELSTLSEQHKKEVYSSIEGLGASEYIKVSVKDLENIGEKLEAIEKILPRLLELESTVKDAKKEYDKAQRSELKAISAAKVMGWNAGKRKKTIESKAMFWEYYKMTHGGQVDAKEKWRVLDGLAEKYGTNGAKAALKHIQTRQQGLNSMLKKWKDKYGIEVLSPYSVLPPNYSKQDHIK